MSRTSGQAGFSLMEVVVALSIAGILLLGAHWILTAAGDGAELVTAESALVDRSANAERLLKDLAGRAEVRFQDGPRFRGDARGARWGTWCETASGWLERCEITVGILTAEGGKVLAVSMPDGTVVPVREDVDDARILYLRFAADGGHWAGRWDSDTHLPLAIGVVAGADTLLVPIGERG